jgi:hypothetical protein
LMGGTQTAWGSHKPTFSSFQNKESRQKNGSKGFQRYALFLPVIRQIFKWYLTSICHRLWIHASRNLAHSFCDKLCIADSQSSRAPNFIPFSLIMDVRKFNEENFRDTL